MFRVALLVALAAAGLWAQAVVPNASQPNQIRFELSNAADGQCVAYSALRRAWVPAPCGTGGSTGPISWSSVTDKPTTFTPNLSGVDSDDISEGATHRYFSNALARAAFSAGSNVVYNSASGQISVPSFPWSSLTGVPAGLPPDLSAVDSDDLTEGAAHLYFSNARARSALSAGSNVIYNSGSGQISVPSFPWTGVTGKPATFAPDLSAVDSDDIGEGATHRYFSNALARSALSGGANVVYNSASGEIAVTSFPWASIAGKPATFAPDLTGVAATSLGRGACEPGQTFVAGASLVDCPTGATVKQWQQNTTTPAAPTETDRIKVYAKDDRLCTRTTGGDEKCYVQVGEAAGAASTYRWPFILQLAGAGANQQHCSLTNTAAGSGSEITFENAATEQITCRIAVPGNYNGGEILMALNGGLAESDDIGLAASFDVETQFLAQGETEGGVGFNAAQTLSLTLSGANANARQVWPAISLTTTGAAAWEAMKIRLTRVLGDGVTIANGNLFLYTANFLFEVDQ